MNNIKPVSQSYTVATVKAKNSGRPLDNHNGILAPVRTSSSLHRRGGKTYDVST